MDSDHKALPAFVFVNRLTMAGHEFLAASRSKTAWDAVKAFTRSASGQVSIQVASAIMKSVIGKQLGLQ